LIYELSGYAPRIVSENAELLKLINQQIQNLDKELAKAGQEDPQAKRLMTIPGVGGRCDGRSCKLLDRRHPTIS
jgi:transposase